MRSVLVTGAHGFIGRGVCARLLESGFRVIRLAHASNDAPASVTDETTGRIDAAADLSLPGALERVLLAAKLDRLHALVHLAARLPGTPPTGEASERAARGNLVIDEHVFRFCGRNRVPACYSSGTSVYGPGDGALMTENSGTNPVTPYTEAKLVAERRGKEYFAVTETPLTILRISAPYGPYQRAQTVLRIFLQRALRNLPLLYNGSGSRQQDFTYVADVSDAVCQAVLKSPGGTYNIATGRAVTMQQLAMLVRKSVPGCRSEIRASGKPDPQEGATALFSVEKAAAKLGWRAATPLEAGIERCVEFESQDAKCE